MLLYEAAYEGRGQGGGRGEEGERVKARPRIRPEKDRIETVDRRQNNGNVKAVSPRVHEYTYSRAQGLCESRGGRHKLSSLINLRFLWT